MPRLMRPATARFASPCFTLPCFTLAAVSLATLCLAAVTPARVQAAPADINLLSFPNGALIEKVTSTYGDSWDAIWLLDENPATGWASEQYATLPVTIVISMPERSELRRFVFNTAGTETDDRSAREVEIAVSDVSANTGFTRVADAVLKPRQDGQTVTLPTPAAGRWVMLTIRSTNDSGNGSGEYVEIMDVQGFGAPLTHTPRADISGTYESDQYGRLHLRQDGAAVTGCYETKGGLVEGGFDGHLMRLRWREEGGATGPALMVWSRDGKNFRGLWRNEDESEWHGDWDPRKIDDEVGGCTHWKAGDVANPILTGLTARGRAPLDGLGFTADGDTLDTGAKPVIAWIAAALKEHPDWAVTLESHVEATGIPGDERGLSERRAEAVAAAVAAEGIALTRITVDARGADQPVTGNETALGRVLNRRIEIVKH